MGSLEHRRVQAVWAHRQDRLAEEIVTCLASGCPPEVNLSIPRHSVTAPVLRRFAYDGRYRDRSIPVVFRDGSRPVPFPIGRLVEGQPPKRPGPTVKLGLSSFRHPDMDYLIDLYLMRNKDLNDESSMAAEEELTCRRTIEVLDDPALDKGGELWVFHTGLEPMIVGFYRGVIEVLGVRERRGLPRTLIVRPWLYAERPTKAPFDPDSPGARLESYVTSDPWW